MTRKPTYLLILTTALILTGLAVQASDRPGRGAAFIELDRDGDGGITRAEFEARGAVRFDRADADADGLLSAEELTAAMTAGMTRRVDALLARLDTSGDGMISAEELAQARDGRRAGAGMFERLDADADGAISAEEFAEMQRGHGRLGRRGPHGN